MAAESKMAGKQKKIQNDNSSIKFVFKYFCTSKWRLNQNGESEVQFFSKYRYRERIMQFFIINI
jgi:hypothetical protein